MKNKLIQCEMLQFKLKPAFIFSTIVPLIWLMFVIVVVIVVAIAIEASSSQKIM